MRYLLSALLMLCATLVVRADECVIHLHDGSTLRATMLQEKVEITTKYGDLTVPLKDVKKMEVGLHYKDDFKKKIEDNIKLLGSTSFKERELATHNLIKWGKDSYMLVKDKVKDADPEVAKRAEAIVSSVTNKFGNKIKKTEYDMVFTQDYPIKGTIKTKTLKVKTETLGEVDLHISSIDKIYNVPAPVTLKLDGSKFPGCCGVVWVDTGVDVYEGGSVRITAKGSIDFYPQTPGQYVATPKGCANNGNYGQVIAKIGKDHDNLYVGEDKTFKALREGRIYLRIEPSQWQNSVPEGHYEVVIEVG